ncbi:MAG TPA: FAD-dependent oxidoreductase, partial [Acidimicrobiales bacterium]|nr:FAD-dependent oxidoreductase [Acidimicrobiales bacterium]
MTIEGGTDVVVVGSGGAGLAAALTASRGGARVVVLERTSLVGGSTAVSGGGIWVPMNHHMPEVGVEDNRGDALTYCRRLVAGRMPEDLVEAFVDRASEMIRYLEAGTALRFRPMSWPDYHPEMEGARRSGRMLEAEPFPTARLAGWANRVRT